MSSYPTWTRVSPREFVSEEGQYHTRGWVPDFHAYREGRNWFVQWRTSALRSGPYPTGASACASVPRIVSARRKAPKGMTNSDEAVTGKVQHTKPCHDCPMRRNAIPGWLGSATPQEYRELCHSDAPVDCHAIKRTQCAGVAIYRTNVAKRATWALPADPVAVFSTPMEFMAWHTNQAESFAVLAAARAKKP